MWWFGTWREKKGRYWQNMEAKCYVYPTRSFILRFDWSTFTRQFTRYNYSWSTFLPNPVHINEKNVIHQWNHNGYMTTIKNYVTATYLRSWQCWPSVTRDASVRCEHLMTHSDCNPLQPSLILMTASSVTLYKDKNIQCQQASKIALTGKVSLFQLAVYRLTAASQPIISETEWRVKN